MGDDTERLLDGSVVVRGGSPTGSGLLAGCGHHAGVFGFSVQAADGKTFEELATMVPHRKVAVTSVSAIRQLGYDVVPTEGKGYHATVVVPETMTERGACDLAAVFDCRLNPGRFPPGRLP